MKKLITLLCCFLFLSCDGISDQQLESRYSRLSNKLFQLESLSSTEYLESLNGDYRFTLLNGNLTLKNVYQNKILWISDTIGSGGTKLIINNKGRLVLRASSGSPVWYIAESTNSGADQLILNNNGSLILYAGTKVIWSVNVNGDPPGDSEYAHELDGAIMLPEQNSMRLLIMDPNPNSNWNNNNSILWSLDIKKAKGVPSNQVSKFRSSFNNLSEVKRVIIEGKLHLIFCGSHADGVAIVNMKTKNIIYCNDVGGSPHSLATLPDGNLVIADPGKRQIRLFCIWKGNYKPNVQTVSHAGIHGVVWDAKNQLLWAWGGSAMKFFTYNDDKLNPKLTLGGTYRAPSSWGKIGGHDLAPMLGTNNLLFSWRLGIGTFDTNSGQFSKYADLGKNSKGISHNPYRNEVIHCRPDYKDSRTYRVRSLTEKDRILKSGKWYRARWFIHNTFSYPKNKTEE